MGHFSQFSERVISVFGCFGQSLKVTMCSLIDRWAGVKVRKKNQAEMKKGPFYDSG